MASARPRVLVLMGSFWPGGDASGPNQSLRGLCEALGGEYEFSIVARDRPFGAAEALASVGTWTDLGFARVAYIKGGRFGGEGLRRLLRETPHDLLMMNGFFDRDFTLPVLAMRRLGLLPPGPALLSPRGEFGDGALGLKGGVKRGWIGLVRLLNLLRGVTLHATSAAEASDIAMGLPFAKPALIAPNIRALFARPGRSGRGENEPLRLAFLGRITPVKNLDYALRVLSRVRSEVAFDIYGPLSDQAYARACQTQAGELPLNIHVTFKGAVANDAAPEILAGCDMLFLPTLGENFGHAIFEALAAATPVLISDRTPWRDLEAQRAGFDLPLDKPEAFAGAVERMAAMPVAERAAWRDGARALAERASAASDAIAASRAMLAAVLGRGA